MNTLSDERQGVHRGSRVQSFHYPAMPSSGFASGTLAIGLPEQRAARDAALQQEIAATVAAAREKAFQDGQAQANAAAAKGIELERAAIASAVADFVQQRSEYFRRVEREAVRLALAIARKVLQREAQMDPLLLAGIVRVALDQMQEGTQVELRVSPDTAKSWSEFCSHHVQNGNAIAVVADETLKSNTCILQAEVGTTEISIDTQLQEIESGFFDRVHEVQPRTS